jgi:hypothetical protein
MLNRRAADDFDSLAAEYWCEDNPVYGGVFHYEDLNLDFWSCDETSNGAGDPSIGTERLNRSEPER